MATTKKSSTAKTKKSGAKTKSTTKKSTARASAKTTSTQVKKSAAATPSVSVTKTKISKDMLLSKLNVWNWLFGFVYAAGGVVVLNNSEEVYRTVTTTYATTDTIANPDRSSSVVQAVRSLFDVNIAYALAAILFASAAVYLLRASILRPQYEARLKQEHGMLRWLEYGFVHGAIFSLLGLLAGVTNVAVLAVFFVASLISVRAWRLMETINHNKATINWGGLHIAKAAKFIPVLVIAVAIWGQREYADVAVDSKLYWLAGTTFLLMFTHALIGRAYYRKRGEYDYVGIEWAFVLADFVLKAAFAAQIYHWLLRK